MNVLKNVRLVENSSHDWISADGNKMKKDNENNVIRKVGLPEYDLPLVPCLFDYDEMTTPKYTVTDTKIDEEENKYETIIKFREDSIQPSIATLVDQLSSHLEEDLDLHEVCIAGEGEVSIYLKQYFP